MVVHLDGIPSGGLRMRDGDQRVQAIESFARDGVLYKWIGIFGDGMAQIGGQREEKTDRIYGTSRNGYEFAIHAGLLSQLQSLVECFGGPRRKLFQKIGAIRRDLSCRIHRQGPESAGIP